MEYLSTIWGIVIICVQLDISTFLDSWVTQAALLLKFWDLTS